MVYFILFLFVCWNSLCTIEKLRIKCETETENVSVLFYKNSKSSFWTWFTHLTLMFLYILDCSGPRCAMPNVLVLFTWVHLKVHIFCGLFRIMNFTWGQYIVFGFLNVHLLSPRGFFTFLIALAHGEPS